MAYYLMLKEVSFFLDIYYLIQSMTFTKITRFRLYMCQRYQIYQLYSKLIAGLLGHMILIAAQRYEYMIRIRKRKQKRVD